MERIIISLGGSLIVPDNIATDFLIKFKELILNHVSQGLAFVIITGGGAPARRYQAALTALNPETTAEERDWIGIHATRLNGEFIRRIFNEAEPMVVLDPATFPETKKPIIVGAGWKPGCSTDFDAVLVAEHIGAKKIINLSNTAYVYDADPKTNKDAKPQPSLSWKAYQDIIPKEWQPGLNTPFDPIASQKAADLGIEVAIINGENLKSLDAYLRGEPFEGTRLGNGEN